MVVTFGFLSEQIIKGWVALGPWFYAFLSVVVTQFRCCAGYPR